MVMIAQHNTLNSAPRRQTTHIQGHRALFKKRFGVRKKKTVSDAPNSVGEHPLPHIVYGEPQLVVGMTRSNDGDDDDNAHGV